MLHYFAMFTNDQGYVAIADLISLCATQVQMSLLVSWGLYRMAKAFGVQKAWMAWVPLLNVHVFLRVAGIRWIRAIGAVFLVAAFLCIIGLLTREISLEFTVGLELIACVGFAAKIAQSVAIRLGRGPWAALGLMLFPAVFYPVFGSSVAKKIA